MKRFSKISIDDIKNIQIDSGVLLKEFDVENPVFLPENVICATSGGINPVCAPEYYDFGEDVDNAKSAKETKRIRGWNATISFTTLTTSLAAIKLALGAADISGKVLNLRQRLQYAKDFKDIWWVGKRADDKLIAIRLIRSLSDSGFSLQTTKRGKGKISITLKGHSSFVDKNKIPMEMYVIGEFNDPVVPESSLYLYGTPNESGNIGLRNGESVTLYDGAVLPELPETDLQYMTLFLQTAGGKKYWELIASSVPFGASDYGVCGIKDTVYYTAKCDFDTVNTQWSGLEQSTTTYRNSYTVPKWANYKLTLNDGTVVHYSAPIPVTGIVGYSYNGTVLPELPEGYEDYTYAYIAPWSAGATLVLSSNIEYLYDYVLGGREADWVKPSNYKDFDLVDNSWKEKFSMGGVLTLRFEQIGWTNFDLINKDGSVYLSASDPIPVYE